MVSQLANAVMTVMFNSILMRMVGADGVAAIVSFARTFGFLIAAFALMPQHLGVDGVWLAAPAAEGMAALLALFLTVRIMVKRYM